MTAASTVAERVAASRAEQGLPPKIADPSVYRRIATVLRSSDRRAA